jgi:hypothetical protein
MDGLNAAELASRAIKYFLEGLAVAVAMTIIPRKVPQVEETSRIILLRRKRHHVIPVGSWSQLIYLVPREVPSLASC